MTGIRPAGRPSLGYWNDPAYNDAAQPVVGICWHEARAYCAWLSAQTGQCWRLPSEAEWEAAARGTARAGATPGATTSTRARCNAFETHVRGTTPVGVFPGGDTPEGLADMSGNVWEWTSSALSFRIPYAADAQSAKIPTGRRPARGARRLLGYLRDVARCAFRGHVDGPGDR
jgi:formylglycine-generating enzyme required for sulfatase activity